MRSSCPNRQLLVERSDIAILTPFQSGALPEAALLGVNPASLALSDGALTVSALGAEPPDRSIHFHLSALSIDESGMVSRPGAMSADECREMLALADQLNTRLLTIVHGRLDHGLVWEDGSPDHATTAAQDVVGKIWSQHLPEGDGEKILRRFIDDSVNLLADAEFNKRRIDQEMSPINLLWPWGGGFRERVPNLAIRRGHMVHVLTDSLRLAGLTKLAGYRSVDHLPFNNGFNADIQNLAEVARGFQTSIVVLEGLREAQNAIRPDMGTWFLEQIDRHFLPEFATATRDDPKRLVFLAPSEPLSPEPAPDHVAASGLAFFFDSRNVQSNSVPFDERALEDRRLRKTTLWEAIDLALS